MVRTSVHALFLIVCLWCATAPLQTALAEPPRSSERAGSGERPGDIPPLSIETLYHPEQRFQYVKSPAPVTRWTTGEDFSPLLLIKRDSAWMQLDPAELEKEAEPAETTWPGFEVLVKQLVSLGDVDQKKAEAAVGSWIAARSRSLDRALVRIESSLALAGLKQEPRWVTRQAGPWKDPALSPDGTRVAFVQENDLYVMHLPSERLIRITDDGSPTRLNGRLDWVYQEEIYGRGSFKAFWWSDDSRCLALLRLDNTHVRPFTITASATAQGEALIERYPTAGDPITAAELWVARLDDDPASAFSLSPVFAPPSEEELLIVRVGWRPGTRELVYEVANRLQNELTLWRFDMDAAGESKSVAIVHQRSDQWLEVIGLPHWLPGGDFLWLSDLPSGRRRLWRISHDGSSRMPLTPPDFDVRELLGVDGDGKKALLSGDAERGTVGQQVYQISLQSGAAPIESSLQRVTGDLPWHSVSPSHDHRWMVDRASALAQPIQVTLRRVEAEKTDDGQSPGTPIEHRLHGETVSLPSDAIEPQWAAIKTADNLTLPAYVFPPRGAGSGTGETSDSETYPVLIEVYGGPLSPTVKDSWTSSRYLLHQMLANEGIGVMVVDNRSSGGRGLSDAWSIHRRVGEVETKDVLAAVEWLKMHSWVNPKRIAIRGWSFGGFLTLHAMTNSDVFAAGVAGGSVTDWRNYDAIYTERYMGLPQDNAAGYDATSPQKAAQRLHGRVLMIHGEVDDNVHLNNTLQMAAALQQCGKPFDLMIYPGAAHGVHAPMPVYHLMRTTLDFLRRELSGP